MKKEKKTRRACLERSQLKMLFDVLRKKRKCAAASEYIEKIDVEFDGAKKKKKMKEGKRAFWEGWV